jgi:mannose-6-phosphate isomerase-like protein (cupin superfamily)
VSIRAYPGVETALCVLEGTASVVDWETEVPLRQGELMILPAGTPFGMQNTGSAPCLILQISTPRPWSADFQGPEPVDEVIGFTQEQ